MRRTLAVSNCICTHVFDRVDALAHLTRSSMEFPNERNVAVLVIVAFGSAMPVDLELQA